MGQSVSIAVGASVLALVVAYYARALRFTGLRDVCGPAAAHPFFGQLREVVQVSPVLDDWVRQYGRVLKYHHFLNNPTLLVTDLRAVQYLVNRSDKFHKPSIVRAALAHVLGRGVLVAEDEQHRMQRKALNPAFGPGQLRDLTGIFLDKANELRDVLDTVVGPSDSANMNIMTHLSNCTLDIIGLAGFGYSFNALSVDSEPSELSTAFGEAFAASQGSGYLMLEWPFPILRSLPTQRNKKIRAALAVMRRIGDQLIQERKDAAALDAAQGEKLADSRARDILSLLVRANTAADAHHRLSDEEVRAQIPTFLVAGHETTSTLLSWILYRLALHPGVQSALRAECCASPLPTTSCGNAPLDAAALAALDRLPLLDAIVRETLRLDAPVTNTDRVAVGDAVLPLDEPIVDRSGVRREALAVPRGTTMTIPVGLINSLEAIWGADAKSWDPQRWIDGRLPEAAKGMPGVYGSILSFMGGTHACIGFRFSLYETKIILHALVVHFAFGLAVPAGAIGRKEGIVTRPIVESERERGPALPVRLTRAVL